MLFSYIQSPCTQKSRFLLIFSETTIMKERNNSDFKGEFNMIYITGEIHGKPDRFLPENTPVVKELSNKDYFLIAGDFGFLFRMDEKEKEHLDDLESLPFTILFIDGNHENFDALNRYPIEMWHGGKIHRIRKNILHLMRGQVFTIENRTFFTIGGGYSIDKFLRKEGVSWWKEEIPSEEEFEEARKNLKAHDFKVDYIITHAAPEKIMNMIFPNHAPELKLNLFLQEVMDKTQYAHWYFGHLHQENTYPYNVTQLYENGLVLETDE